MRTLLPSETPAELVATPGATVGVVIAPDIFGLRPLFDELVATLARDHGWSVIAVEPFPGRETELGADVEVRQSAVGSLDDARVIGDLVAAADRLATVRTAVVGFCMGGMYANKAAAAHRFDAAVSFYGMIRVPERWQSPTQAEPLDLLHTTTTPVLAIVGGLDPYTPPDDVDALEAVGPHIAVARYPEAEHGFVHDPNRPAHRPDDAADAWRRAISHVTGAHIAG